MSKPDSARVARRCSNLAPMLLAGTTQRKAASELGVCRRTIKYDVARLKRIAASGRD